MLKDSVVSSREALYEEHRRCVNSKCSQDDAQQPSITIHNGIRITNERLKSTHKKEQTMMCTSVTRNSSGVDTHIQRRHGRAQPVLRVLHAPLCLVRGLLLRHLHGRLPECLLRHLLLNTWHNARAVSRHPAIRKMFETTPGRAEVLVPTIQ